MRHLWLAVAALAASLAISGAAAAGTVTTVMSGLDNPRGLAFGPEGALYVAEAGRGGTGPCTSTIRPLEPGQPRCYGPSGAVSRLWRGVQERVVTGLPSYVNTMGQATGPHDIAMMGRGNAWVSIGWGTDPLLRSALGTPWTSFNWLARVDASGSWRLDTDLGAYEVAANPDDGVLDSNPYGLLAEPGQVVVADAGANALLAVRSNGSISTLATLPSRAQGRPTDAVPTAVTIGPDGAYYLAQLTGVPFTAGVANVYRVVPGRAPTVAYTGFTTIIDLTFGPDGSLYVLEHSTGPAFFALPGRLLKIASDGTRTTIVDGLTRPGSVAVGPDGALYVSIGSISVGTGEVLRIEP
ncbi:MAG: ScyD/ScyE family protein [Candidatus Doudnabacteria bacterium]